MGRLTNAIPDRSNFQVALQSMFHLKQSREARLILSQYVSSKGSIERDVLDFLESNGVLPEMFHVKHSSEISRPPYKLSGETLVINSP